MKYETIVILDIKPTNEAFIKQWGYNVLLSLGFEVVLLNIFPWVYGDKLAKMPDYGVICPMPGIKQKIIHSKNEFFEALDSIKSRKICMYMASRTAAVLRALEEKSIPYMTQQTMGAIHGYINVNSLERISNSIRKLVCSPRIFIKKYAVREVLKFYEKKYPPAYHITMRKDDIKDFDNRTKIIINHSFDYDRFLRNRDLAKPEYAPGRDYVLLLANHMWEIHDNMLDPNRTNKLIDRNEYKELMLTFLNRLRKLIDKEIVISAAPSKTKGEDIYDGYRFLLGVDTDQLVKYSLAVFGHYTGAFNFAVLHRKPISFVSFRKLHKDVLFDASMKIYSKAFNVNINYVDTLEECEIFAKSHIFEIKKTDYDGYIKEYIKTGHLPANDDRRYWDRVYECLANDR